MAKVTVAVAVFLLLVAVAQARFPFDLVKKTVTEEPETVPKATATNLLLLPTEKPEPETVIEAEVDTVGIIGWDVEITESETLEGEASITGSDSDANSDSVTVISFGPANRQFKKRLPLPFSRGHHCHHLHQYEHGNLLGVAEGMRFRGRGSGYGDGMILSEEGVNVETVIQGRPRLVPGRWMRFRNGNDLRMYQQQQRQQQRQQYKEMQQEQVHEHDQEKLQPQNQENKNEHDQEKNEPQSHENNNEHDQEKNEQQSHENKTEHEQEKHEQQNDENKNENDQVNVFLRKIRKFLTDF